MTAALKAARRLLATIGPAGATELEINRGVKLATALQAVLQAHMIEGRDIDHDTESGAIVAGFASAIGWLLAFAPRDGWPHALRLLVDQTLLAADTHAGHVARQAGTTH